MVMQDIGNHSCIWISDQEFQNNSIIKRVHILLIHQLNSTSPSGNLRPSDNDQTGTVHAPGPCKPSSFKAIKFCKDVRLTLIIVAYKNDDYTKAERPRDETLIPKNKFPII